MHLFINNNVRFCYQSKGKVLSSNSFGRVKIWTKKDKNWKFYWWWFRKGLSDNDYNDEMESDDEYNDEMESRDESSE